MSFPQLEKRTLTVAWEEMRSPLAVGWVEYCQVLACESVGNVKPNMTRLGDRTRVEVEKQ
jgi:hypothetical protein